MSDRVKAREFAQFYVDKKGVEVARGIFRNWVINRLNPNVPQSFCVDSARFYMAGMIHVCRINARMNPVEGRKWGRKTAYL